MKLTDALLLVAYIGDQARHAKPGDATPVNWAFRAFGRRLRLRGIIEVEE